MKRLLMSVAVLMILTTAALAQFDTDHFKCYVPLTVSPTPPAPNVRLADQFITQFVTVRGIWRFCNPTEKNHNGVITPITNPDAHLALHITSATPIINRQVTIQNQFGIQTLLTGAAKYLAVPTQKEPHGPATNLDHFRCYKVTEGPDVAQQVFLTDQWFGSSHIAHRPVLFCNPVEKTHNGMVTHILHPNDHLTCYKITSVPIQRTVQLHNQFGDPLFTSRRTDLLCVPTQKLAWQVVP